MPDPQEPAEDYQSLPEEERLRRLRLRVDLTAALIRQADLTLGEALRLIDYTRAEALRLFPDKEETYDLIYTPRFERILRERFGESV